MKKRIFFWGVVIAGGWLNVAEADIIGLKNGNIIEGVILRETEKSIELEVFPESTITFGGEDIAFIKKWEDNKNQTLREKWLADQQQREEAELARQEFEREQRAKGLVKYDGKWIPEAEKERLEASEYIENTLSRKEDTGAIVERENRTELARSLLAQEEWRYKETEHFIIYYQELAQAKVVADRAEYYYEKIFYDLTYEEAGEWEEKCEVFIIPNQDKWRKYAGSAGKEFASIGGFVSRSGEKEIYLCSISLPYLSVSFPHELTHLIFYEFAEGRNIPLWLNEGLAIYESGIVGYDDKMLQQRVVAVSYIPIKEMLNMRDYPANREEMELFYAQSQKAVGLLLTQYGRKKFA
ncbi:MAG: hypothetical protein V1662_05200, partial [Candidatus Omnitrophota bacterium]